STPFRDLPYQHLPATFGIARRPSCNYDPSGGRAMISFLGWILFGLIVGAVAKLLMPGRDPGGIIVTMLLGIAGALLGGSTGRALGLYKEGDAAGFLMSLLGAVILLALYRLVVRRRMLPPS